MLSTPALSDRLALDVQSAQALRAGARAGDEAALRKAAKEFEAMVVNMMLKTMRETRFNDGADDPFGGQTVRLYQEMLDQQWSRKMVEAKGFGFADMIVERLKAQQAASAISDAGKAVYPLDRDASAQMPLSSGAGGGKAGASLPITPETKADGLGRPATIPLRRDTGTAPVSADKAGDPRQAFIERLRPYAEAASQATGVPTEFILAHAALESGWGRREITHADGSPTHNLFGIKAGGGWKGDTADVQTTEYRYGVPMKMVDRFRAYADLGEAFMDYADLLKRRYAEALQGDAEAFATGLQKGGYATDPAYAAKLRGVIASLGGVSG